MKETIKLTEEVKSYKCNWCYELYKRESEADMCAFNHAKENLANSLLNEGCPLSTINYKCGFGWKLTDEQMAIDKTNCFVISHWQCCKKPAYKIVGINYKGELRLCGKGQWDGYYAKDISITNLKEPHEESELFVYSR